MEMPEQTPSQPPVSSSSDSFSAKILFVFLGFVIILVSIGGGIFLYSINNKNSGEKPAAPTITTAALGLATSTSSPTTTSSQTGHMKIYQNRSYKFSLLYPDTLQLKEASQGLGVTSVDLRGPTTKPSEAPDFQFLLLSKSLGKTVGQDFDADYSMPDNTVKNIQDDQGNTQRFIKLRTRTIGSLRAFDYKTTADPPNPDEEAEVGTYVEIGNNILIFSTGESNRPTLDSMLGSLKYPI